MNISELNREREILYSGHSACPGCGAVLTVRHMTRTLGPDIAMVITASCWSIIAGMPPLTALKCPILHCPFPSAGSVGGGLKRGLIAKGHLDTTVVVLAGDGGTFDIGLQALSGAAQRNEDYIFICYDNEAYMNTGMQTSSATPYGARTNTAPYPLFKEGQKKNIMQIMAAHSIPYAATATVAFPDDMERKLKKAKEIKGFRFIHILSPCPPGWGAESSDTIHLSRLAVTTGFFPLYEIYNGITWKLTSPPDMKGTPLNEYLDSQKRFNKMDQIRRKALQEEVDHDWSCLMDRCEASVDTD
ncbi:MAG: thiamine pyrophosphate-dependent enzyme [Bacillota bacterium]|nr:thiamine pyrophosphate-dependent enzyme [Bacillota bacterium]